MAKYWRKGLGDHDLVVFGGGRGTLQYNPSTATFQDVLAQLPAGWEPELVIWWLPELQPLLPGLVECPFPLLAQLCHFSEAVQAQLGQFDLVAAAYYGAPLYGFDPDRHKLLPNCPRAYDVTYVGDLNPVLHQSRLEVLARVSVGLGAEFSVRYFTALEAEEHARVLNQSRISLHPSLEISARCYEAPACGSLLFCAEKNDGVRGVLGDKCVYYNESNLIERLRYYLENEEERAVLARASYEHIQQFTYRHQSERLLKMVQKRLRRRQRTFESPLDYLCSLNLPGLPQQADQRTGEAIAARPDDPEVCNQRGCVEALMGDKLVTDRRWGYLEAAVANLSKALSLGLMVRLSLAQVLLRAYRKDLAASVLLEAMDSDFQEVVFFPRRQGALHTLWEREPDRREASARWQLYELLSQLVPERCVEFCHRALEQRQDMATTWFRLGLRLEPGTEGRLQALERACELAPYFIPALVKLAEGRPEGDAGELVGLDQPVEPGGIDKRPGEGLRCLQAAFPRSLTGGFREEPRALSTEPPGSLNGFLRGISFDWLQPADPIPSLLAERAGSELEYGNTCFAFDDERIKQRFARLELVPRMSTLAIHAVLHRAVADMPPDQVFVNVGIWHGFTLLSGLLDNGDKVCIGIDNFSQFGGPKTEFLQRFEHLRGPSHRFYEMDYQVYFQQHHSGPLGVYLYDGEHSYANQLQGLRLAEPYFAPGCIVLVDDTNWNEPRQASLDFVAQSSRRYELLLDARTADNGHPTWWNGFMVFRCIG